MENDQEAYLGDRNIVASLTSPARTSRSDRLTKRGHPNSVADSAKGSEREYEETPLLSRDIDASFETPSTNSVSGDGGAPKWSGANDFSGQPWWKRPSVSTNLQSLPDVTHHDLGLLADSTLLLVYNCLRRNYRPKDQSHTRSDM